jgi:hypothetical protein
MLCDEIAPTGQVLESRAEMDASTFGNLQYHVASHRGAGACLYTDKALLRHIHNETFPPC